MELIGTKGLCSTRMCHCLHSPSWFLSSPSRATLLLPLSVLRQSFVAVMYAFPSNVDSTTIWISISVLCSVLDLDWHSVLVAPRPLTICCTMWLKHSCGSNDIVIPTCSSSTNNTVVDNSSFSEEKKDGSELLLRRTRNRRQPLIFGGYSWEVMWRQPYCNDPMSFPARTCLHHTTLLMRHSSFREYWQFVHLQ